ncbi:hypothetical protein GW931_03460 [archaeon]|nr:hypothetical protein [archaeon]PJC45711.1 MAG: hypothetical protein CO037_00075 [Candidatus Pacearchaeota archaeon CG_4_9_14_0_2_um_filter_30_8]
MRSETDKTKLIVKILIAVVVLLAIIVLYLVVFQQQYNNFVDAKRVEGIDLFISQILIPQLQQTGGYVQIPVGNQTMDLVLIQALVSQINDHEYAQVPVGNQTLYLVPVQPGQGQGTGTAPEPTQ